ncbi:MAG: glycoside hydrolase family 3 protein, partial [Eggerthellaceae bacterium]|nr:glycoside hydrolase family 3 protein [Eggerthellaceae bacterium]
MGIRGFARIMIVMALALVAFAGVLAAPACAKAPVTPVLPEPEPLDTDPDATPEEQAAELLSRLTLEEKIAQLFIITPEALTGYDTVTAAGRVSKQAYSEYPVGGLIYFARNIEDPDQVRAMLAGMQVISRDRVGLPLFTCIDEEGGLVVRIADNPAFGLTNVGDASAIGATGDAAQATLAAETIAAYLHDLGFNVNFAPVADVVTDFATSPIGDRSFG